MKTIVSKIYVCLLIALFGTGGLFLLFGKANRYSENENRFLQQKPVVSVERILSGELQGDLDSYTKDQLIGRDIWMAIATNAKRILNHREVNGVYLGKNGYLFPVQTDESDAGLQKNMELIGRIGEELPCDLSVMLVPDAATVMKDAAGGLADMESRTRISDQTDALLAALETDTENGKTDYFRTDHHWNSNGAYQGAKVYLESRNVTIRSQEDYGMERVSEDFYGTTYSKVAGLAFVQPDTIELPADLPENLTVQTGPRADSVDLGERMQITCSENLRRLDEAGFYALRKLSVKDQYAVYFGGNYDCVRIENPDQQAAGKRLLIVKDSFANSLVPYLTPYYESITMIDLRYFNGSFSQIVEETKPTEALVLYEKSSFAADRTLYKLIES